MQCCLVPVDGEVRRWRVDEELLGGAGEGAAAAEAVPRAARAPRAVAEDHLQRERVLVPQAVVAEMKVEWNKSNLRRFPSSIGKVAHCNVAIAGSRFCRSVTVTGVTCCVKLVASLPVEFTQLRSLTLTETNSRNLGTILPPSPAQRLTSLRRGCAPSPWAAGVRRAWRPGPRPTGRGPAASSSRSQRGSAGSRTAPARTSQWRGSTPLAAAERGSGKKHLIWLKLKCC